MELMIGVIWLIFRLCRESYQRSKADKYARTHVKKY